MEVKLQVNVYKGLPMVLEKVKSVALSAVMGMSNGWLNQKLDHHEVKGSRKEFYPQDLPILNNGIECLGSEILASLVTYEADREAVIAQVKALSKLVYMPYIYTEALKKNKHWYTNRITKRVPGGKACSFSEDDILKINMAAIQIANELKSLEFTLE